MSYSFNNIDNKQLQILSDESEVNLKNPICERTVDSKIRIYDNFGMFERFYRINDIADIDGTFPETLVDAYNKLQQICAAISGTVSLAGSQKAQKINRRSDSGSIEEGLSSISIANVGAANGTVATATLKPGETVNFNAGGNNTLAGMSYDATDTEFLIITID
jgi:hypothetical protein